MAIVTAEIRFAPQLAAWFTANPTLVLADGELAYCSDGANAGKYKLGDNSTQLQNLTFYGGVSSSGLTVGTTTITSGTNTRILYNNNGNLGEYLVTGTGTTAVLSNSPTFINSIYSPVIYGGTGISSTIQYRTTDGVGSTGSDHIFQTGTNGATELFRMLGAGYNLSTVNLYVGSVGLSSRLSSISSAAWTGEKTGYFQNSNSASQSTLYLENDRGSFGAYGGFLIGGSTFGATSNLFGLSRQDTLMMFGDGGSLAGMVVGTLTNTPLYLGTNNTQRLAISGAGNVSIGTAAIATNATNGFLYVTSCAGVPTGVPTTITGRIPIVADSTNNKLYIYSGGAWVALN